MNEREPPSGTKAPNDLASHFRWHGDAFTDAQVIDTLTPRRGRNTDNDPALRAEPVWDGEEHEGSWRAVWAYSAKRLFTDECGVRDRVLRR